MACGPFFPNSFLDRGDDALLAAPVVDFDGELEQLKLPKVSFQAQSAEHGDSFQQTITAEERELQKALGQTVTAAEKQRITDGYKKARTQLEARMSSAADNPAASDSAAETALAKSNAIPRPIVVPAGLPGEFADYLRGMIAYKTGDKPAAEAAWKVLLDRPTDERRFRTVWATYMLGRNAEKEPDKAIEYFENVRELTRNGFPDSIGLAEASLGWEARAYADKGNFCRAIELYLQQYAAEEPSAAVSLRFVSERALKADEKELEKLAWHPQAQRIVTACVVSRGNSFGITEDRLETSDAVRWLNAVESANVRDMALAERLAVAAYQAGQFEIADRWIKRSPAGSPTANWIKAKLLLRQGKLDAAAALLSKVAKSFPLECSTNAATRLEETVHGEDWAPSGQQVFGELATIKLAKQDYVGSLDAFLHAGFMKDAGYVAEKVLTSDELKRYVNVTWPPIPESNRPTNEPSMRNWNWRTGASVEETSDSIRGILARRLTRISRGSEAREYFSKELQPIFDQLAAALNHAYDESDSASDRAQSFWIAAQIVRTNGMELLGTEVEPDWASYEGAFDVGSTFSNRLQNIETNVVHASTNELQRVRQHTADPDRRFHYRYIAADLAWHAAKLMPNDTKQKAVVLWTAGNWLKIRDPQAADRYYKELVRRCRHTNIGAEADRIRWFPALDDNGNVIPREPNPAPEPQPSETPDPAPQS